MIELNNATRVYPMGTTEVRALNGVSLRIERGEFVAVVGSSGSGKSTMMHVMGCLDRPSTGEYHLLDQCTSKLGDRQLARLRNRSIGFVFQTFNLISRVSAWENVAMPMFYARKTLIKDAAIKALFRVNLDQRADHAPNELSGGERQRVAIARAIVNEPAMILADEPTGNLDTRTGAQIMQIFHDLHRAGTTVVLVTHEPEIAQQADRIVTMRDGLIVEDRLNEHKVLPDESLLISGSGSSDHAGMSMTNDLLSAPNPMTAETHPPTTPDTIPESKPELHPLAAKSLKWSITGSVSLVAMMAWNLSYPMLEPLNPLFMKIASVVVFLVLLVVMIVSPFLGFLQGRRARRWINLAPERFVGIGRATAAMWISLAYFIVLLIVIAVMVLIVWSQIKDGTLQANT